MVAVRRPPPRNRRIWFLFQWQNLALLLRPIKFIVGALVSSSLRVLVANRRRRLFYVIYLLLLVTTTITLRIVLGPDAPDAKTKALRKRNNEKAAAKFQRAQSIYQKLQVMNRQVKTLLHVVPSAQDDNSNREEKGGTFTTTTTTTRVPFVVVDDKDDYECLGWRNDPTSPHRCSLSTNDPHSWRLYGVSFLQGSFGHYGCDDYLPYNAGYCEWKSRTTGKILQLVHKPCQRRLLPGELPEPPYLTCDMALAFSNYKVHAKTFQPQPPLQLDHNNNKYQRGIVMQAYNDVMTSVYVILKLLRTNYHCPLPVELWCREGELDLQHPLLIQLQTIYSMYNNNDNNNNHDNNNNLVGIHIKIIPDSAHVESYMTKPHSIAYSEFEEVLFLDSDNFPLRDPTFLFDVPQYQTTGALFWKDFWAPSRNEFYLRQDSSLLWELLDIPADYSPLRQEMEMESGQLVINRRRCRAALQVLLYFSQTFSDWFQPLALVLGDKDLFRLAWYVSDTPYYYVPQPPGMLGLAADSRSTVALNGGGNWWKSLFWSVLGRKHPHRVCGLTMIQYEPPPPESPQQQQQQGPTKHQSSSSNYRQRPLFLHRNAVKLTEQDVGESKIWEMGAHFNGDNNNADVAAQYKVDQCFVPHILLGRMCYYPHPDYEAYFTYQDYRSINNNHDNHDDSIQVLEERMLTFAREASELVKIHTAL